MAVFIGGAWPYANGSLHLGHIASLLPGDILARYYRLKGEEVLYVSGSDCNGTPISIRASQEGTTTEIIAEKYHQEFVDTFGKLGFTYDYYTRTDSLFHHQAVQGIFLELLDKGFLEEKTTEQAYCEKDERFLPDRFVEGRCPVCGANARGDQCDHCSSVLDPLELKDKKCKLCGEEPVIRETAHYYFAFDTFSGELKSYVDEAAEDNRWRDNAIQFSKRYLREGLRERAITRDLPNGIDVPVEGLEGKKIYVWLEAVAGYLTASQAWGEANQKRIEPWWNPDSSTKAYYVHGKDNIPFHTIIWPALLLALGQKQLPTHIVSNEYVTLEKRKISTSNNWAVWIQDMLNAYHPDSIRYFLTVNAPEQRDADFSWQEFILSHNGELLGAYGNFVNRTLKFIEKNNDSNIPQAALEVEITAKVKRLYPVVGEFIEAGKMKQALNEVFDFIREANKYFDVQEPWKQVKENLAEAEKTLATCVYIIVNTAQLLHPFLPYSTKQVQEMLAVEELGWKEISHLPEQVQRVIPIFERIDKEKITEEKQKLMKQSALN
ncbi:methionine--tRNA ligase [Oceanobacillus jeddahense]|uniref:Methionine--tRNA ligase n=1 Tax=Oceanobacillus jeddahense TaxID=1462527 RepID=A0ABY5JU96_9BACI|nr:methionine--tRNA ligase [Oceanobacillus jeddahense]UUI03917.1 methionine--tRNA ligase [Oceanobacillus jeddahense]